MISDGSQQRSFVGRDETKSARRYLQVVSRSRNFILTKFRLVAESSEKTIQHVTHTSSRNFRRTTCR